MTETDNSKSDTPSRPARYLRANFRCGSLLRSGSARSAVNTAVATAAQQDK